MKFSEATTALQEVIRSRFNLPEDTENVYIDEYDRPYTKNNGRMMFSLKSFSLIDGGFHTHGGK